MPDHHHLLPTSEFLRDLATRVPDAADQLRLSGLADEIDAWDEQDRKRDARVQPVNLDARA